MNKTILKIIDLFVLSLFLFTVGCASIDSKPFVKFDNAVKVAGSGMDSVTSVNYNWTRSGFVDSFSKNSGSDIDQITITVEEQYNWSMKVKPLYLTIKKSKFALNSLNNAFADYADLLVKLSGSDLIKSDTFDQLAKDINTTATDAATALKLNASPSQLSLFSRAAADAVHLYIESKRQDYLRDAINNNQANVEEYAKFCNIVIHVIRVGMETNYKEQSESITNAWKAATDDKRKAQIEAMLTLNDQFINSLEALQAAETVYNEIPKAHAELAQALENQDKSDYKSIQRLYSAGVRLQRLCSELKTK